MTNYFSQIRKAGGFPQLIKELSDRISRLSPAPDDDVTTIRHARVDVSRVTYSTTGSDTLDGTGDSQTLTNSDALAMTTIPILSSAVAKGGYVFEQAATGNLKYYGRYDRTSVDTSGSALTVTVGSAVTVGASGAQFPGADANSIITLPDNAAIRTSANFSICFWFYPTDISADGGTGRVVICKSDDANNGYHIAIHSSSANIFADVLRATVHTAKRLTSNTLTANQAQHIAITWTDTASVLTIYRNGTAEAQGATGSGTMPTAPDVHIGCLNANSRRYIGYLWDVRHYNATLTATEVANIYKGGSRYGVAGVTSICDVG